MINSKIPFSLRPKYLDQKIKQTIITQKLNREIKQQDYLNKMYSAQIQILEKRKKQFQDRFNVWQSNKSGFKSGWVHSQSLNHNFSSPANNKTEKYFHHGKHGSMESKLDQSLYFQDSPQKRMSNFGKKKVQSPIKKLNLKHSNTSKLYDQNLSVLSSPQRYNKIEQLQAQINELLLKLQNKEQKNSKIKQDQISQNLLKKIKEQEQQIESGLKRMRQLQLLKNLRHELDEKIQRIKQQIFKQKQGLNIIKQQQINKNKDIIKLGYTQKMMDVIAAYGGVRK